MIPFGSPASENVTSELNPFAVLIVTERLAVPPVVMLTLLDESARAKSRGAVPPPPEPPPPHPVRETAHDASRMTSHWIKIEDSTRSVFTSWKPWN